MSDNEWSRIPVTSLTPWYRYNGQGWIETDVPMTDNERDTHFQGSASLVIDKIDNALNGLLTNPNFVTSPMYDEVHQILTHYSYDLVKHTLDHIWEVHNSEHIIENTPDLKKWADSQDSE